MRKGAIKLTEIRTPRLLLRGITLEDKADFFEFARDPEIGLAAGWKPHESIEETESALKDFYIRDDGSFGIVLLESCKLIGSIGTIPDPKRDYPKALMMGFSLAKPCWGNGFMTEAAKAVLKYAFESMGAEIVSAYCYPDNAHSESVLKKCGMKYEGRMALAEECFDGIVRDNLLYAITKQDYLNSL